MTITVQYPPSLKSVVLLEVNNSSPLVTSILTLPATGEAHEEHYLKDTTTLTEPLFFSVVLLGPGEDN